MAVLSARAWSSCPSCERASVTDDRTVVEKLPVSGRQLFWIGFYTFVLAAWTSLYAMSLAAPWQGLEGPTTAEFWASLCVSAGAASPAALFGMWALMSAAMMMPTFVPAIRVFDEMTDAKASDSGSMVSLVAGYVAVWLAFSAAAAGLQALLAGYDLLAPDGTSRSVWLTAVLFLCAGAYQLTLVKSACLAKCRHPLIFFMQYWRPGNAAAFHMGLRLGAYCVGCCWVLMLLGFVGGTMNLLWMGAATLFMIFEKLPGIGAYLTRPAGIMLLAAGASISAHALELM